MKYDPLRDRVYMSTTMQQYFRDKLYSELAFLKEREPKYCSLIERKGDKEPDILDQSATETLNFNNYAYNEHELRYRREIETALQRLDDGSYGYCAATGKPIGVERLLATPQAIFCVEEKEKREKNFFTRSNEDYRVERKVIYDADPQRIHS